MPDSPDLQEYPEETTAIQLPANNLIQYHTEASVSHHIS